MSFDINNLISQRNLQVLKTAGLHKVAAAMYDIPAELTLKEAAQILGSKAFYKRASTAKIFYGLGCLENAMGEKTANLGSIEHLLPHAGAALPTAALAYLISKIVTPMGTDPSVAKSNDMQALGVGGGVGLIHSLLKNGVKPTHL